MSKKPTKVLSIVDVEEAVGSSYPPEFDEPVAARCKRRLGEALGIANFGVNLVTLPPGVWSSQRHWHKAQDEFVYVVDGELVLVTEAGEQVLTPGMIAGFPAGNGDGHHLINRSDRDAIYLEVGDRKEPDETDYPDIDMQLKYVGDRKRFMRRNGEPY